MEKHVKYPANVFTLLVLTTFATSAKDVTMGNRQSTCNSSSEITRHMSPSVESSTDFLCSTSDSPSQATQSNDSTVKTPVAAIVGSLFGAVFLVFLILRSVFIISKRRKRYADHITNNHGNSSLPSITMSSRAPHPLPLSDNARNFKVTEVGMAGKIFSVEADTATTFPSAYKGLTTQAESAKRMPSRSTNKDVNVENRFATQMQTIANTNRKTPASNVYIESSSCDVYSQVNRSARQFSILTSAGVHKDSSERGTRSFGGLKSNSASFDPLYSRVVKMRSSLNNPTSAYVPDYVNIPSHSSLESLSHTSSKDVYPKVFKLPAKLSSTMYDNQNTASQHVLPSLQIIDEEVYSQIDKGKQERKKDKATVHQRDQQEPTLPQSGPLHKNLRCNLPLPLGTKFPTNHTKEVIPAEHLVPAPTAWSAPGSTSSATAAA